MLEVVELAGLKLAVTPLGRPEAEKVTFPLNPLAGLTVMPLVALPPGRMLTEFADAFNVKFPAGFTVRATCV